MLLLGALSFFVLYVTFSVNNMLTLFLYREAGMHLHMHVRVCVCPRVRMCMRAWTACWPSSSSTAS